MEVLNVAGSPSPQIKDETEYALGRHLTIEFYDCEKTILNDPKLVEKVFINAAIASGAHVLGTSFHNFKPQGVSGFVVISESHFSVHAWPEFDYAAVDIFTCGDAIDFHKAIYYLNEGLQAESKIVSADMNRGIISNNGFERMVPVYEDGNHTYTLNWKKKFERNRAWGLLTSVDVYKCNPELIRDASAIKQFVYELCDKIEMKRYGECNVVNFGEDERVAGFSMTQFIETSLISGHFANESNTVYLDIFSCKFYEPRDVSEFAVEFFKGEHYKMQVALRR